MTSYILRRLLFVLPVLWGAATLIFFFIHLIPGDPIDMILGDHVAPGHYERLSAELGLDQPLWTQYWNYLSGLLHGDWGTSIIERRSVLTIIFSRLPYTVALASCALLVTLLVAIPMGTLAALKAGTWIDTLAMGLALLGICLPTFWAGPFFQNIFSVKLDLLPVSGSEGFSYLILPSLTLGAALSGITSRLLRSKMLDVQKMDYILAARAKGLSEWRIVFKHIFRNALIPLVTIVGLQLGALLGGAVVTESIFNWPGLGLELVQGIQRRDFPVVQGIILWITISYVVINLLTDLVIASLSPQIRLS